MEGRAGKAYTARMFKKPRKTIHTDNRRTCESVHDTIVERLAESDQSTYFADIMPFLEQVDTLPNRELRVLFKRLAHDWMNDVERRTFDCDRDDTDVQTSSYCTLCDSSTRFTLNESDAVRTCDECGCTKTYIGASSDRYLPYDFEVPPQSCPYRRSNHFQEWLNAFMARQSGFIPDDVFDGIRGELKKQRIVDMSVLTQQRLRTIMKTLRLNKYYENAQFILYHLKGVKAPTLSREVEDELRVMFNKIQAPFDRAVKKVAPERRNFLSYSYTIYKMLELMELDYLLIYFPLLKSRTKLIVQDLIWKEICNEVKWRFIPSV